MKSLKMSLKKSETIIDCQSLSKQYVLENGKKLNALDEISLTFYKGTITGIVGKNGCGKTTLLKILSGIIKPTTGRALIYGKILSILEVGAGFHHELSGRENVYLVARQFGLDKKAVDKLIPDIIEFSEMNDFMDVAVKFYSQGMYLRLAISTILFLNAGIYLFDEVIAVGDAAFQEKCIAKIRALHEKGVTIILVSHSYNDIQKLCDRCIVLSKGRIIADGPPVLVKEAFETSVYPERKPGEFKDATIEFTQSGYLSIEEFRINALGKNKGDKLFTDDQLEFTIVWTKINPDYGIAFHIHFLDENEYQFLSTSNAFAKNDTQFEELKKAPCGQYTYKLVIPPHFFNSVFIKAHLSVAAYITKGDNFQVARTIEPMLIKVNEKQGELYFSKELSPLRARMNWEGTPV